jgi:hypothetical protein
MNVKQFNDPITIGAWLYNDRTYVGLTQNGEKILPKNTKDNSEAPQPKEVTKMGKTTLDWSDTDEYYYNFAANELPKKFETTSKPLSDEVIRASQEPELEENSGLPF